jgi:hypothetical protein
MKKDKRMKVMSIMVAVFVLMTAVSAVAVQRSGNDIRLDCSNLIRTESSESLSKDKILGVGYCIGLIDGLVTFNYVYETVLQVEGKGEVVQMCLPERISTRQMATTIVKFLDDNPGRLQESGQALAAQALVTAYPCDQETEKEK